MSAQSYLLAWLVYLAALTGFLVLGWYLSRRWPIWLRHPARALVAALLLLPWSVSRGADQWAPAWIVTIFDGLMQPEVPVARAGLPLLLALAAAVAVAIVEQCWRQRQRRSVS